MNKIACMIQIAEKLDSAGMHTKADHITKLAGYSIKIPTIPKVYAREISLELAKRLRFKFPDIIKEAWATGSFAYEDETTIQNTETKDVDLFIKIKGDWNKLPIQRRKAMLMYMREFMQEGNYESHIVYDIFMSDDNNELYNFTSDDLSYLPRQLDSEFDEENYEDIQDYHQELLQPKPYHAIGEEQDNYDYDLDYPITKITNDPIIGAPEIYSEAPGWRMWGIRDKDEDPKKIYWRRSQKPQFWDKEQMIGTNWAYNDPEALQSHFYGDSAVEDLFETSPAKTWQAMMKRIQKQRKIRHEPEWKTQEKIDRLVKRIGAWELY